MGRQEILTAILIVLLLALPDLGFWAYSSRVEQRTHNPLVTGSNPVGPTISKEMSPEGYSLVH